MIGEQLTSWTIRLSLLCFASVLAGELSVRRPRQWPRRKRLVWTAGCLLFLAHVACVFHFYHDWSHSRAVLHTADKTRQLLGWAFGGGIFFNYAFGLLWVGNAAWMWIDQESHRRRYRGFDILLHTFMLFIAVNGSIVFASGAVRWMGIAVCVLLVVA